ncbi:phosphatidylinositol N-acetylglucosaminyltransferase subunit P-like [Amphibalanus amphitrite]|uniref:phosphatidylinositol N-acetylglucosaminyltransferase subunit P-like n=1 Tax=Amphibalanus amphitrite TaxID=1232801 RepID=UPI001C900D35|nr:phosphatidylinositol N-acetylglucosaminyltransferase subunit P-like [Amphibalanus amphitrite]XP_043225398.1 phosphatidylinositol N-acetylglucosaminyltransferase subunit P-like [Amphibalanus amphitrite]
MGAVCGKIPLLGGSEVPHRSSSAMPPPAAPENGPAPTPSRAVYGFLLFVASILAALVYLSWALVPPSWLLSLGLDYWPQQLWALTVPTTIVVALFLFVLVIYPLLGLVGAPSLHDPRVYEDEFSVTAAPAAPGGIPPVCDISLSEVCRHLYLDGPETTVVGRDEWPPPLPDSPPASLQHRARRRQSERPWDADGDLNPIPRLRSRSERDARQAERGNGDVRWRIRGELWRARRRRLDDSGDGLSAEDDS